MKSTLAWVASGPGFEDSAAEPWYDDLIAAWRTKGAAFEREAGRLDG
jgi:hypothetical protein